MASLKHFFKDIKHDFLFYLSIYIIFLSLFYFYYASNVPILYTPSLEYKDVSNSFQTFDILYFTCFDVSSYIGKVFQQSVYTHIGMIVNIQNRIFLWESDNHKEYSRPAVDLLPIEIILNDYPTNYYALKKIHIDSNLRHTSTQKLYDFIKKNKGKQFKFDLPLFIQANYKLWLDSTPTSTDEYFCSELIADTYSYCGLMDSCLPSWSYIPADFYYERIPLKKGIRWGDEIDFYYPK